MLNQNITNRPVATIIFETSGLKIQIKSDDERVTKLRAEITGLERVLPESVFANGTFQFWYWGVLALAIFSFAIGGLTSGISWVFGFLLGMVFFVLKGYATREDERRNERVNAAGKRSLISEKQKELVLLNQSEGIQKRDQLHRNLIELFIREKKEHRQKYLDELDQFGFDTTLPLRLAEQYEETKKEEKERTKAEAKLINDENLRVLEELQQKEKERKTEVERQRKVEENRKTRLANIKQGIHKPESYEAAEAFIRALKWSQVEVLAVDLMECKGWVARLTEPGADKGIDAFATQTTENGERKAVVQVKDWKDPVRGPVIRETIGSAAVNGISEIFVITSGRFTSDAKEAAEEYVRQSHKNVCELWNGDQLISTIINMPNDQFLNMVISEGEISSTYQLALNEGYAAELNI